MLTLNSTPWLTTKRRTCPICKGDVVRSMDQPDGASPSRAAGAPSLLAMDDVQVRAGETTNNSPLAALPVPRTEHGGQTGLGGADYNLRSSPGASSRECLSAFAVVGAAGSSSLPQRMTQSLPERER